MSRKPAVSPRCLVCLGIGLFHFGMPIIAYNKRKNPRIIIKLCGINGDRWVDWAEHGNVSVLYERIAKNVQDENVKEKADLEDKLFLCYVCLIKFVGVCGVCFIKLSLIQNNIIFQLFQTLQTDTFSMINYVEDNE